MAALSPQSRSSWPDTARAASFFAPAAKRLPQQAVGGHAACDADLLCAGILRGQQQLFGQNVRDAELEAGGHIGHVHTFSFHLRFVHKIEHSCFQTGEADVVRALYMGVGRG